LDFKKDSVQFIPNEYISLFQHFILKLMYTSILQFATSQHMLEKYVREYVLEIVTNNISYSCLEKIESWHELRMIENIQWKEF